jgi:hypothetical protein
MALPMTAQNVENTQSNLIKTPNGSLLDPIEVKAGISTLIRFLYSARQNKWASNAFQYILYLEQENKKLKEQLNNQSIGE